MPGIKLLWVMALDMLLEVPGFTKYSRAMRTLVRPLSQVDGVHMTREVTEFVEFLRTKLATERLLLCVDSDMILEH